MFAATPDKLRQWAEQLHRDVLGIDLGKVAVLLVCVQHQRLAYLSATGKISCYPVSTALNGTGCDDGSGCTPIGWHEIAEKIGGDAECGAIFKARVLNGLIAGDFTSSSADDVITSRILWLRGLQPGINLGASVDSYQRYIYIHGTAQEHLIGFAVSHGCVRMKNHDVITLFDQVQVGDRVLILPIDTTAGPQAY